jgi:hypothetical protein
MISAGFEEKVESRERGKTYGLSWIGFGGRLGLRRTLLLVKEALKDIPSDIAGLVPVHFKDNVREVSEKLRSFLSGLLKLPRKSRTYLKIKLVSDMLYNWEHVTSER